jgi:hypothetical protein
MHLPVANLRWRKENKAMSTRTIRVKVRGRHLELLEALPLPEGSETTVVVKLPDPEQPLNPVPALRTWDLGLGSRQVTREDAYDNGL